MKRILILILTLNCGLIESKDYFKKEITNLIIGEKYEEAIKLLKQEFKKYPADDYYPSILGSVYHEIGDDNNSLIYLIQAVKLNPKDYNHHANLGFLFYKSGSCMKAIPPFEKSLELGILEGNNDNCMLYYSLGVCSFVEKDIENGKKHLSLYLKECKKLNQYEKYTKDAEGIIKRQYY